MKASLRIVAVVCGTMIMCASAVAQQGEDLKKGQQELKDEVTALKGEVTALKEELQGLRKDIAGMSANIQKAVAQRAQPPAQQQPRPAQQLVGQKAPEFDLVTHDGKKIKIGGKRETPQVLFCYASWCGFCKKAIPGINTMYEKYKDKGVEVLAVNLDDRGEGGRAQTEAQTLQTFGDLKLSMPMTMTTGSNDTKAVGMAYKAQSFPTLFVLGKTGEVESVHIGAKPGLEDIVAKEVDLLMAGKTRADFPAQQ